MTDGWTDGWTDGLALAHPYHVERLCSKFGKIPPSGLKGSVMDRWTDSGLMKGQTHGKIILLSYTVTMRRSEIASLVELCPVVSEEIV